MSNGAVRRLKKRIERAKDRYRIVVTNWSGKYTADDVEKAKDELSTLGYRASHKQLNCRFGYLRHEFFFDKDCSTWMRMLVQPKQRSKVHAVTVPTKHVCPNCNEIGAHFVPPSLGEPGFYTCKKKEK